MNKLFFICPDCYLEQEVRQSFGEDCFFVTALGSVWSILGDDFWSGMDDFIAREQIGHIYIVNDTDCTFVGSALLLKPTTNTEAEKFLIELTTNPKIDSIPNLKEKKVELCKLNLQSSAQWCVQHSSCMRQKLDNNEIILEGLLFDRKQRSFTSIKII
jgi:carbonic anhydrase